MMARLRNHPRVNWGGIPVTVTDLLERTDAVILAGGDDGASVRMVVRPSGTEPKVKCYTEVRLSPDPDLAGRGRGPRRCSPACSPPRAAGSQRGPNCRSPASPRPGTM